MTDTQEFMSHVAWLEGREAYRSGQRMAACPYFHPDDWVEQAGWENGWWYGWDNDLGQKVVLPGSNEVTWVF